MRCPYCLNYETKVIDSRDTGENELVTRRRRECLKCENRFTTYEKIELPELFVIKKDGKRELFDIEKIKKGLLKSFHKREISIDIINKILENIEKDIRSNDILEIKSKEIGKIVMKYLKKTDNVAYIRFASVYREFADIDSFAKELNKLKK
ncbi:MAG: transcriptional regulator NrdR [Candidatus Woesearchaeota archaeon]